MPASLTPVTHQHELASQDASIAEPAGPQARFMPYQLDHCIHFDLPRCNAWRRAVGSRTALLGTFRHQDFARFDGTNRSATSREAAQSDPPSENRATSQSMKSSSPPLSNGSNLRGRHRRDRHELPAERKPALRCEHQGTNALFGPIHRCGGHPSAIRELAEGRWQVRIGNPAIGGK